MTVAETPVKKQQGKEAPSRELIRVGALCILRAKIFRSVKGTEPIGDHAIEPNRGPADSFLSTLDPAGRRPPQYPRERVHLWRPASPQRGHEA